MRALAIGLFSILAACGGDDGGNVKKDAAIDTPPVVRMDAAIDAPKVFFDGPPGTVQLTIHNYIAWCNVSETGAANETKVNPLIVSVAPNATYTVNASGATGFEIEPGMWHHVDEDTSGNGADGTQTTGDSVAHVTVGTTNKCIWVCCQFNTTHTGCSGLADQCP